MLSIVSWNIRQGGGTRVALIIRAIITINPQIVILSEFQNTNRGITLRNKLLSAGFRYQYVTAAKERENSVIVMSKIPGNCILHPDSDINYPHNIIEIQFSVFALIGVYFPHKKRHKLISYIKELVTNSALPYIICGDFNTGKNYLDQKGNSFWYQQEMADLESANYLDAFRQIHGAVKEYSWYSHQGNGYRYDHTYLHKDLLPIVQKCHYLQEWREKNISDHSPMILILHT